jgi:hypothetical protein
MKLNPLWKAGRLCEKVYVNSWNVIPRLHCWYFQIFPSHESICWVTAFKVNEAWYTEILRAYSTALITCLLKFFQLVWNLNAFTEFFAIKLKIYVVYCALSKFEFTKQVRNRYCWTDLNFTFFSRDITLRACHNVLANLTFSSNPNVVNCFQKI